MELWDVYDKNRNLTGKKIIRQGKEGLKENEYGLIVAIALFNKKGEMLIQQRQSTKASFPNLWEFSAGGHSISGENSQEAIGRELFEEIGYKHDFSNESPYLTINTEKNFCDYYIVIDDSVELSDLKLQQEEVQAITWATKREILQLLDENKFVPYSEGLIELLFFMYENGKHNTKQNQ